MKLESRWLGVATCRDPSSNKSDLGTRSEAPIKLPASAPPCPSINNNLPLLPLTTSRRKSNMSLQEPNTSVQPAQPTPRTLPFLDSSQPHSFIAPAKRINEGHDVPFFLTSKAYSDIGIFMMQLNTAMCPRKSAGTAKAQTFQLDDTLVLSEPVQKLQELMERINLIIEEAPPDTGPRRFGNVSFRKWYEILESRVRGLLEAYLPRPVLEFQVSSSSEVSVLDELTPYLMGAFGSSQRLDYGTGHELSFLAFLGCIWKLGGFTRNASSDGELERSIVLGVIEPYVLLKRLPRYMFLMEVLQLFASRSPAHSHLYPRASGISWSVGS